MAGRDPPFFVDTENDHGAVAAVTTFVLASITTLATAIRIFLRQKQDSALGLDDALLAVASVCVQA